MKKAKLNKSFISKHLTVTKGELDILKNYFSKYEKETFEFIVHIYDCTQISIRRDQKGFSPVPYSTIVDYWGQKKVKWQQVQSDWLLEVTDYSWEEQRCREYKLPDWLLNELIEAAPKTSEEYLNCQFYNAFTGKKVGQFQPSKLTDDKGNSLPELIRVGIEGVSRCSVNFKAIEAELAAMKQEWQSLPLDSDNRETLYRRWVNDQSCFNRIRRQNWKIREDGLGEYTPSYRNQYTGRIGEIGGGFQSMSRVTRSVGLNIPGIRNYDLKSSQLFGLKQWFEIANIDTSSIQELLDKGKYHFASQVGISVDCWKKCCMAMIMGAIIPNKKDNGKLTKNLVESYSILEYLYKEAQGDIELTVKYLQTLEKVTSGFRDSLKEWHKWLIKTYIPENAKISIKDREPYIKNAVEMTYWLTDYVGANRKFKNVGDLKRKVAAFLLQGAEAQFIYTLTGLQEKYRFKVVGNAHDGMLTVGEIPEAAVQEAKEKCFLKYAQLEEKPLTENLEKSFTNNQANQSEQTKKKEPREGNQRKETKRREQKERERDKETGIVSIVSSYNPYIDSTSAFMNPPTASKVAL
ncbi:hypothetical protein [Nostoc sp. PA-18-2419]|uniref:hypothetical protein n=1 Tax=Nostoc sp. PA-18-2419 TaxID=2575443 RepID=UPI0011088325|nr:hypothetical protein [Nostoc sp. PA-18-2419]